MAGFGNKFNGQNTSRSSLRCKMSISNIGIMFFERTCWPDLFNQASFLDYMGRKTFTDLNGRQYDKYDLINQGYRKFTDIPREWLSDDNHLIQRSCFDNNEVYVDKDKIKAGFSLVKYPIYHLDFESFPCPLPRFKGEFPIHNPCFNFPFILKKDRMKPTNFKITALFS